MGRPTDLTFELVATTADKLKTQNGKTNAKAVHTELAIGGSLTTVYKLFTQWEAAQTRQSNAINDTLDQSVARAINNLMASKLQDATSEANQRLANMQINVDMFSIEIERLELDLESKSLEFTALSEQHSLLAGRILQLETDAMRTVVELASERQSVELARLNLAKAELRLEAVPRIETELDKSRQELLKARTEAANLHEIAAVATAKLESETIHRKTSDTYLAEAVRQREAAENRALIATEALHSERLAVHTCQGLLDAAAREAAKATSTKVLE